MYKNGRSYSPSSVIDAIDRTSPPRNGEFQRSFSRSTDSLDSLPTFGSPALDFTHSSVRAPTVQQQQQQQPPHGPGKCRLLPCRTFISTGSCCYGDRCVFLHDQSIVSKPVFVKYLVSVELIASLEWILITYLCLNVEKEQGRQHSWCLLLAHDAFTAGKEQAGQQKSYVNDCFFPVVVFSSIHWQKILLDCL